MPGMSRVACSSLGGAFLLFDESLQESLRVGVPHGSGRSGKREPEVYQNQVVRLGGDFFRPLGRGISLMGKLRIFGIVIQLHTEGPLTMQFASDLRLCVRKMFGGALLRSLR